jgi:hypothetical protein
LFPEWKEVEIKEEFDVKTAEDGTGHSSEQLVTIYKEEHCPKVTKELRIVLKKCDSSPHKLTKEVRIVLKKCDWIKNSNSLKEKSNGSLKSTRLNKNNNSLKDKSNGSLKSTRLDKKINSLKDISTDILKSPRLNEKMAV